MPMMVGSRPFYITYAHCKRLISSFPGFWLHSKRVSGSRKQGPGSTAADINQGRAGKVARVMQGEKSDTRTFYATATRPFIISLRVKYWT